MRRIPWILHGRAFATLRTLMQATPPLGAALATPLLVHGQLAVAAVTMTIIAARPALHLMLAVDDATPTPETAVLEDHTQHSGPSSQV